MNNTLLCFLPLIAAVISCNDATNIPLPEIDQQRVLDYALGPDGVFESERINALVAQYAGKEPPIEYVSVNCDSIQFLLEGILERDQDIRHVGEGDIEEIDANNQQQFFSIIKQCGFFSKDDKLYGEADYGIWLIFQHAGPEWMGYYYPEIKQAVANGVIRPQHFAYMQDRFLLNHQQPQIFGTQFVGGELYCIEDPDNVERRRAQANFGGFLDDYVSRHGLNLVEELERLKDCAVQITDKL